MTGFAAAVIALCAACGAAAGAFAVPWAADALLSRAYRRSLGWWRESLQRFQSFREAHGGALPSRSAKGSEGALGIWLDDARSQARKGVLTHERALALREAGIEVDEAAACRSEREQQLRCSFRAKPWHRAAIGAALGLWCGLLPVFGTPPHLALLLAACGAVMAVAVVCDLQARMIPLECCAALLAAGGAYQLLCGGLFGLAAGAAASAVVLAVCWVANRIARLGGGAVGFGDVRCMVALAVACGPATLMGAAACYASAAAFSLAGIASRRLHRRDGIPMAPFLTLWLAFGTLAAR